MPARGGNKLQFNMEQKALAILRAIRYVAAVAVMISVWLLVGMAATGRFVPPFDMLLPWLMPWKGMPELMTPTDIAGRVEYFDRVLSATNTVAEVSFVTAMAAFAALISYLIYVYQQRQIRAQENALLLMKNEEVLRRNEFIRYISATIGHEFKNNLGRIKRRLDLAGGLPAGVKERVDGNFEKLFADIEIFKKIADERESGLVTFSPVDIGMMLSSLAGQYSDFADVSMDRAGKGMMIYAAGDLLRTVFENLFDNAVKYKKPERGKASVFLSCSLDMDGRRKYLIISFRDEGIGMDEEQADLCFYKRSATPTGWGEGLYFVKYVIGLHAGKIRVGKEYTAPGRGTEIIIHLPLVEEGMGV